MDQDRAVAQILAWAAAEDNVRAVVLTGSAAAAAADDGASRGYDRPFIVLLDKDGLATDFSLVTRDADLPDQDAFDECCHWAAAAALMTARAIARDEPWSQMARDADLKAELLRMIEWTHTLRHGPSHDVHHRGTRMRQWMDPQVQRRLEECAITFGRDNRAPLVATLDLFGSLAREIATARQLTPFDHARVRDEVRGILGFTVT